MLLDIVETANNHDREEKRLLENSFWGRSRRTLPLTIHQYGKLETNACMPEVLSQRETEVLGLIIEGLSNKDIAVELAVSLATTKSHVRHILNKLGVSDRTQAVVRAIRYGIVVLN